MGGFNDFTGSWEDANVGNTAVPSVGNDVWATIKSSIPGVINAGTEVLKAKIATQAAPGRGGVLYPSNSNPFPGTQGAYPQAEAKPAPGGAALAAVFGNGTTWLLVGVFVVILAMFARR